MDLLHRRDNVLKVLNHVVRENFVEVIARQRPWASIEIDDEVRFDRRTHVDVYGVGEVLSSAANIQASSLAERGRKFHVATVRRQSSRFQYLREPVRS